MTVKYLLRSDEPPMTASGGDWDLIWQVKIFESTTPALLQNAINTWLLTDPVTTGIPRWLGPPVYINSSGGKVSCLFPYAYYVEPTIL